MAETYTYQAALEITQGGYNGEWKGVIPFDSTPHTTTPDEQIGIQTYQYYYTDSNTPDAWPGDRKNAQSSRVTIWASDVWTASFDEQNNLIINVTTNITNVERGNIVGNPNYSGNYTRDIKIGRSKTDIRFTKNNDPIGTAHRITGAINLGTEQIILPPGGTYRRGSIYILNHTSGFPETEIYTDEMEAGIFFQNNAPLDYRPGATYIAGTWQSHNRSRGANNVWDGSKWVECRTENGGVGTGNPPLYYNNGWKNQKKVGENG